MMVPKRNACRPGCAAMTLLHSLKMREASLPGSPMSLPGVRFRVAISVVGIFERRLILMNE